MKINFKMDGGFAYLPAFSKPFTIDTTQIDPQVANEIETLVREAHFFEQPAKTSTVTKGAADLRTYTITVEDSPHLQTLQVTDPISNANLHKLVSYLRNMAHPSK